MSQHVSETSVSSASSRPRLARGPITITGKTRSREGREGPNEDAILVDQRRGLAAVFDGVGGSAFGEVASQIAVRVARKHWQRTLAAQPSGQTPQDLLAAFEPQDALQQILQEGHERIQQDSSSKQVGSDDPEDEPLQATTAALACIYRQPETSAFALAYAYVGDSRVYLLRNGEPLLRLTNDDGYFRALVENDSLSEADALRIDQATHDKDLSDIERTYFNMRNGITQALGDRRPIAIHSGQLALQQGDRILLCSDGIHDNLIDSEIEETLLQASRTTAPLRLLERAQQRSREDAAQTLRAKPDDMSAIVITCHFS